MHIVPAHTITKLPVIRELFTEYAKTLDRRICFKDFEHEMAELPGGYAPPEGRLLLAMDSGQAAGCVALRKMMEGIGEMKRLFVRPAFRGRGLGRKLAEVVIAAARESGYSRLRLDTLPQMREAITLYESLNFRRLPPVSGCDSGDAIDMELTLQ